MYVDIVLFLASITVFDSGASPSYSTTVVTPFSSVVSVFDIVQALDSLREPISIFEPIYSDGGDTIYLVDQIEDKSSSSYDVSMKLSLDNAIGELDERSQYILDERFLLGKTQMEIAQDLKISQAQVSRIEKGAVKQLKKKLK